MVISITIRDHFNSMAKWLFFSSVWFEVVKYHHFEHEFIHFQ